MRAIVVSVDYSDLLAVTLPYNRHHFEEVLVVTSPADAGNVRRVLQDYRCDNARVWPTDAFCRSGAAFNKWLALEEALDDFGRRGWLCLLDADVLWPKWVSDKPGEGALWRWLRPGYLYAPLRRMYESAGPLCSRCDGFGKVEITTAVSSVCRTYRPCFAPNGWHVPDEHEWDHYPVHRNTAEWAGYSQIFHASDPALGPPPWHEVDWAHAGGADSLFQRKWPAERKVRPPFEVLHLGPAGQNWYGRATPYLDGTEPADAAEKRRRVAAVWEGRGERRRRGLPEAEQFRPEKLGGG